MQTLGKIKYKVTGLSIPEELFTKLENKRLQTYESRSHLYSRLLRSATKEPKA